LFKSNLLQFDSFLNRNLYSCLFSQCNKENTNKLIFFCINSNFSYNFLIFWCFNKKIFPELFSGLSESERRARDQPKPRSFDLVTKRSGIGMTKMKSKFLESRWPPSHNGLSKMTQSHLGIPQICSFLIFKFNSNFLQNFVQYFHGETVNQHLLHRFLTKTCTNKFSTFLH
jgi:hypothetical protein